MLRNGFSGQKNGPIHKQCTREGKHGINGPRKYKRYDDLWLKHTIIPKTDNYGKRYCCADCCNIQETMPVLSQGRSCN